MNQLIIQPQNSLQAANPAKVPPLIAKAGKKAVLRFVDFFMAEIENVNTRNAYAVAVIQFGQWCDDFGIELTHLNPSLIATYMRQLGREVSRPTVKQHLAAIRSLFDYLVIGQIMPFNPANSVRGPKYVVKQGKTPILTAEETRLLLDAINIETISGLRDRALIGIMVFSFARVSAVINMNVEDYFLKGRRAWFRLHEKGGKYHEVPTHSIAEEYLEAYLAAAGIGDQKKTLLFRSLNRKRRLSERRFHRRDVLAMVKRRARQAGLADTIGNHTFRGTGITTFLQNNGTIERAQQIAAHESPRTTKLYDRRNDELTPHEIERIRI